MGREDSESDGGHGSCRYSPGHTPPIFSPPNFEPSEGGFRGIVRWVQGLGSCGVTDRVLANRSHFPAENDILYI